MTSQPRTRHDFTPKAHSISETCQACQNKSFKIYVRNMYQFQNKKYDLIRCSSCGLVQVNPMPSGKTIKQLYDLPDYFELDYDCGITSGSYFENRESILQRHRYALDIFNKLGTRGNFLEIGCAGGFFLDIMKASGWKVWGLDLSKAAIAFAKKRKLNVLNRDLYSAKFKPNTFDAILMGDVFEHVPDPVAFLKETQRILKPGGTLIIKTPAYINTPTFRIAYLLSRMFKFVIPKKNKFLSILKIPDHRIILNRPYHLYEYSPHSMKTLLENTSFSQARISGAVIQLYFFQQLTTFPLPTFLLSLAFHLLNLFSKIFNYPLGTMISIVQK
jgi:2-polyprenyl-3-methyl-5-hydroxy-6-metoxy-1,4-benzoquinol methylase